MTRHRERFAYMHRNLLARDEATIIFILIVFHFYCFALLLLKQKF